MAQSGCAHPADSWLLACSRGEGCTPPALSTLKLCATRPPAAIRPTATTSSFEPFFFFSLFQVYLNLASRSKVLLRREGRERWRDSKPPVVHEGKYEAEKQKGMGNSSVTWEQLDIIRSVRNLSTFHNTKCNEEMLAVLLIQILWLSQFVLL